MPEKFAREESTGTSPQSWTGPCARADLEEAAHRCAVPGLPRERPPQEVLVERERSGVRVALLEVDVRNLEVRGREHDALAQRRLQIGDVVCNSLLDAIRIAFSQRFGPGAVADVELTGRVAFHVPGQLLELDPEQAGA